MKDAEKLTGKKYKIGNFADTVEAIHAVQKSMGITGTTAKEATTTLSGSFGMLKDSFTDFLGSLTGTSPIPLDTALHNLISSAQTFAGNLAPMLLKTIENIGAVIGKIFDGLPAPVQIGIATITTFIGVFKALKMAMQIGSVISQVQSAISGLFAVLAANPIIAIIAAVAALAAGLYIFFTKTEMGKQIWASLCSFMTSAWDSVK